MCIYIWAFPLFCNALRLVKATLNGCINSLSEYVSYPYSVRTIKKAQLPDCSKSLLKQILEIASCIYLIF